ncbi:MAG: 2-amino-4-hydroxy-6-hydroxymethyldihydropteridine diphosphokinase [Fimbriimonadaceae bacterium]
MPGVPVLIALGSNIGDSVGTVRAAAARLKGELAVARVSKLVRSKPMYVADQPAFVNAVVSGETELGPFALLALLKRIEREFGRQARVRNGPRELDMDILAYGALTLRSDVLELPHPRLPERRFVLQPLAEVAPDASLPGLPPVLLMLAATEDQAANVQPISDAALSI